MENCTLFNLSFLLVLLQYQIGFAQAKPDSSSNSPAAQLNNSSYLLRSAEPDSALLLAGLAGQYAAKASDLFELGRSYFNQTNALLNLAQYPEALQKADSALICFRKTGNKLFEAKTCNSLGVIYGNLGSYGQAVDSHLQALAIRQLLPDSIGIPVSMNNLGAVYQQTGDVKAALDFYQRALDIYQGRADTANTLMVLSNIGALHSSIGNYSLALRFHQQALALAQNQPEGYSLAAIYSNLGADLIELGDIAGALQSHKRGLQIKQKLGDQPGQAISYINIGQCYFSLGQYAFAQSSILQGRLIARAIDFTEAVKNADRYLSAVYEKLGNLKLALFYQREYSDLKDSLFNEQKAKDIGKVEERFRIERLQEEKDRIIRDENIRQQTQVARRNRLQYSGIMLFIIGLFVFAGMQGRVHLPPRYGKLLIFLSFLVFFEFSILLLDPYIETFSRNIPLIKLFCNLLVAIVISPLHEYLTHLLTVKIHHIDKLTVAES